MKFNPKVILDLLQTPFCNCYLFLIDLLCFLTQIIIKSSYNWICLLSSDAEILKQNCYLWNRHPYFINLYYL